MIGSVNAITEDMEFMTLNFRPKSEFHEALFTLHSAKASTSTGKLFFPEVSSKKVAIANIYDVNRDGVIGTTDIDIIMNYILNN